HQHHLYLLHQQTLGAPPFTSPAPILSSQQCCHPSNVSPITAWPSTNEHSLSPAGLREGEGENNLDLEDSLPPSTGSGVALTLVSSAAPSASGSTPPVPSQVRDFADENNLDDEDPLVTSGEGSFLPTVPLVSQPSSAPDPPHTFEARAQVRDFADENNLNDEDPVTPSRGTITPQTLPVLPVVPPASLLTVPNPTRLSAADENNFDASTPPGEGSANPTLPLVPSPTSVLHNLGRGRVLSETDENNLDDEDPLSPLLQSTYAIPTASASLVSSQPSFKGPRPLSTTSLPPKIEENNLDEEHPCSPSALAASTSATASLPPTFPPTGNSLTSPLEFTVTPSKSSLPTNSLDADLNAGDESTEGQVGGARGGASSVVAGNHLNKPTAPPVVAETAGDPFAALNNLDTYSQNDENNLNEVDDTSATGLGAVGVQQNPDNSGTVVTNSLNPEFSSVGISRVASGTVAAQDVVEENNLDEEDMLARARVAGVEPSVPVERIKVDGENDLNEDSLTSCTVSRAQESGISHSNSGSGQAARSLTTSSNLEFSGEQTAIGVAAAAAESNNPSIARQPLASDATAMNNLGVDQPSSSPAANDLSVEGPSQGVRTLQMQSPLRQGVTRLPTCQTILTAKISTRKEGCTTNFLCYMDLQQTTLAMLCLNVMEEQVMLWGLKWSSRITSVYRMTLMQTKTAHQPGALVVLWDVTNSR
ncbi:hypothetical protein GBAR_LOCUS31438, partial [Geodia barretti]